MPILMMDPKVPFIDFLLYVVIRKSMEIAGFYERLSRSVKLDALKTVFNELAKLKREEVSCLQIKYGAVRRIFSEEEEPIVDSALSEEKIDVPAVHTIEDACQFALNLEIIRFRFYTRLAQLELDARAKELFLFILFMHRPSLKFLVTRLQLCQVCLNPNA